MSRPKSILRIELEEFYKNNNKILKDIKYENKQQKNKILTLIYSMRRRGVLDFERIIIDKKIDVRGTNQKAGTITIVKKREC